MARPPGVCSYLYCPRTLRCQPTTEQQTSIGSPVSQQGALFEAAVCSSSGQHALGLQHHHLRFFQKAPSVVDTNMEPSFLDDNCSQGVFWSWLFLSIIRTTTNHTKINSKKINNLGNLQIIIFLLALMGINVSIEGM